MSKNILRILLIQGLEGFSEKLLTQMKSHFELKLTRDPIEGLEWARIEKPDAILLGILTPTLRSCELCYLLRSNFKTQAIPVFQLEIPLGFDSKKHIDMYSNHHLSSFPSSNRSTMISRKQSDIQKCLQIEQEVKKARSHEKEEIWIAGVQLLPKIPALIEEDQTVTLTQTEAKLILLLAKHKAILLQREELAIAICGGSTSSSSLRSIDVHICSIRKKSAALRKNLRSVYGKGYRLL